MDATIKRRTCCESVIGYIARTPATTQQPTPKKIMMIPGAISSTKASTTPTTNQMSQGAKIDSIIPDLSLYIDKF